MQRRHFLKTNLVLAGLLPFYQKGVFVTHNTSLGMNTEVVRFKVGSFSCTIFRDLLSKYAAKDFFINAAPDELAQAMKKYNIAEGNIPSPFIALLIQDGKRNILVDTGVGFSEKPVVFRGASHEIKGRLHTLLQQENMRKEDITDVILTHFHPDHIGGIYSEEDKLNFPNARFYVHEDEWQYWHSSRSVNQPGMFRFFIEKNISKLKDKNLQFIKGDLTEVLPGITSVNAGGHTPGQIAIVVHSGKDHLLYASDTFLHPLHIHRLDWQTNYDENHAKAKLSRAKLLDLAYQEDMLVNVFHFDFPGLGRIEKHQNGWNWRYAEG